MGETLRIHYSLGDWVKDSGHYHFPGVRKKVPPTGRETAGGWGLPGKERPGGGGGVMYYSSVTVRAVLPCLSLSESTPCP